MASIATISTAPAARLRVSQTGRANASARPTLRVVCKVRGAAALALTSRRAPQRGID